LGVCRAGISGGSHRHADLFDHGQDSGVFVTGVADNVIKFAAALPAQSLVGIAIVLALIFMLTKRVR
jgi:hypothetical protein